MMKYQFCIRFNNIDANSAASKAVLDCNKIFLSQGYKDYTFTVGDNKRKGIYYLSLFKQVAKFFFSIKRNSLIGIQYPLLSVNNVFKYFIKAARLKGVRFFCIVHDLESLRIGGTDKSLIATEIENLNYYDQIIVHNQEMADWLAAAGIKSPLILLDLFDYLTVDKTVASSRDKDSPIVYAGNLGKSTFIYSLSKLEGPRFNLYGPNFDEAKGNLITNTKWQGQYSPDEIPFNLDGSFGLIWDGSEIDSCDNALGNYLKFNNPHKASLYLAAGLPIIAPADSAIGKFILRHGIGLVVNCLNDIKQPLVTSAQYSEMLNQVNICRKSVINGTFFKAALSKVEKIYA